MTSINAAECLLSTGEAGAIALECGTDRISYADLRCAVQRAASAWHGLGLRPGERVMVFAPDSIDWVIAYLGVLWAGGVAIGVNPRLTMKELAPILNESRVRFVWCEAPAVPELSAAANILPEPPLVVASGGGGTCVNWTRRIASASELMPVRLEPDSPALWIGTSGTTGIPKGVVHAQRVVIEAHAFACEVLGVTAADRLYATSKLFFAYALANSLFAGLRAGATVILDHEWPTADRVAELVEAHQPTVLFSVPTLYNKMLQGGVAQRIAKCGIRHFVSAGEALPNPLREGWQHTTDAWILSGYGTSETLSLMLYSDDASGALRATPRTELRFDDGVDTALPQRIWVRHPAVALGYWERPDAQAECFCNGWFSPGDIFLRRRDGGLEFAGRNDDMLKIAGQWVSTLWVEQSLAVACGESVQQIAAVGVTTAEGLSALAVLAVAAPGEAFPAQQRLAAGIEALPGHRRPRWVHWVDALPLTATGKLQRGKLRELHERASRLSQTARSA